ncbi:hypothetical protein AGMMS49521_2140 [Campylobacterota bacterium]|nr:hypothetical protein AGMMS49521_2140 [Campylobacterota bacterium]
MASRSQRSAPTKEDGVGIYDIPDKLEPVEAIWYYNVLVERRDEIYNLYFVRLKRVEEWLEIYVSAEDGSAAKEMAFAKISSLHVQLKDWVELHEARYRDERMVKLCLERIETIVADDFDGWRQVFDLSPYGSQLQLIAMRRMRPLASTIEHYQAVYDRSEMGSSAQIQALQNMLLLGRFEQMGRKSLEVEEQEAMALAVSRGPKEWMQEYEKHDLYDPYGETALCNAYIAADAIAVREDKLKTTNKR